MQDVEINERIIKSALSEFDKHGFAKASMRNIAKQANVTTGALYNRYQGKDDLFKSIVSIILDKWHDEMISAYNTAMANLSNNNVEIMFELSIKSLEIILDFIYENKQIFDLLVFKSKGSQFENFLDQFIQLEQEETFSYYNKLKKQGFKVQDFSKVELAYITQGHFKTIFEVVKNTKNKDIALKIINSINIFYIVAWKDIFGLGRNEENE